MNINWGRVLTSKTVWLGVLVVLAGIFEYIAGVEPGASITTIIAGCLGVIIRFLTSDSLMKD